MSEQKSHFKRMFKIPYWFPTRPERNIIYILITIVLMNVLAYQYKLTPDPYNVEGYVVPERTINYGNVRGIS